MTVPLAEHPRARWKSLQPRIPEYDDPGFDTARRAWLAWWEFGKAMGYAEAEASRAVPLPLPIGPLSPVEPVTADGSDREDAIFVPARDGVTPGQVADAMHLLNHTARHIVEGKFVVLPPGAKILPASLRRSLAAACPEMASPHYQRMCRIGSDWHEILPGLQCRFSDLVPAADPSPGEAILLFRLTPEAEQP